MLTNYDPYGRPDEMVVSSITSGHANYLQKKYQYVDNRTIKPSLVKKHADRMRSGKWLRSTVEFYRCATTGEIVLGNGQHRFGAQAETGTTQEYRFILETLTNMDAIRDQYSVIDDPSSGRSIHDVIGGTPLEEVGRLRVTKLRSAMGLLMGRFNSYPNRDHPFTSLPYDEQIEAMCPWIDQLQEYMSLVEGYATLLGRGLLAAPAMAVAMVTLRDYHDEALKFWRRVCRDTGLEKGAGDFLCNRFIREDGWNQTVPGPYRSRYIATCWNVWLEDGYRLFVKPDVRQPIHIAKTVYSGSRPHDPLLHSEG